MEANSTKSYCLLQKVYFFFRTYSNFSTCVMAWPCASSTSTAKVGSIFRASLALLNLRMMPLSIRTLALSPFPQPLFFFLRQKSRLQRVDLCLADLRLG